MTDNVTPNNDVEVELPAPRDCYSHGRGHNPHWIQVLNVKPRHGYVSGMLKAERTGDAAGGWVFRFTPNITRDHTLPMEERCETLLFNHDPDRLIAALARRGDIGRWTPGAHLFQIEYRDSWPTFDMSLNPIGPCLPSGRGRG